MSAFNAKNLTYTKQEPSFLRKLRGETANDGRHNVAIPRPRKAKDRLKTGEDDDEDGPVILDESGERVQREEFERMVKGDGEAEAQKGDREGKEGAAIDEVEDKEQQREKQTVAEVGGANVAKKRKGAKVIRDDEADGDEEVGRKATDGEGGRKDEKSKVTNGMKKEVGSKRKGKKVKLSFDEPE